MLCFRYSTNGWPARARRSTWAGVAPSEPRTRLGGVDKSCPPTGAAVIHSHAVPVGLARQVRDFRPLGRSGNATIFYSRKPCRCKRKGGEAVAGQCRCLPTALTVPTRPVRIDVVVTSGSARCATASGVVAREGIFDFLAGEGRIATSCPAIAMIDRVGPVAAPFSSRQAADHQPIIHGAPAEV